MDNGIIDLLKETRDEQKKLVVSQIDMGITLQRLTDQVEYHIKRTDVVEATLSVMQNELEPVKRHVQLMNLMAKVIVGGSALALTILKIGKLF